VFTEENPQHEFLAIAEIAAASRVLKGYNDTLAARCLSMAEELWKADRGGDSLYVGREIQAAIELYLTTHKDEYKQFIIENEPLIKSRVKILGWVIGRALPVINDVRFSASVREAIARYAGQIASERKENPFGVPYKPYIWGSGWSIQKFGVEQYFLHSGFPDLIGTESFLDALNFVLGCHPGENTASFVSGVGSRSMTVAYGYNRDDWSYIPGGVVSGTALIRPDFPEMKDFPFLWQQSEYVIGGGASNFMFLVLAADEVLSK
jgi:hypothetical protein